MTNKSNYIIASAGTGKTESIIKQIEKLIIQNNVDISEIALITFTNKATKEMRDRLRQKLYEKWKEGLNVRDQLDKLNMSKISTIHSFCDDIIREYGLTIGISPNYKINSFNYELNEMIDVVVERNYHFGICSKIPTYIIKDILKDFYKETKDKGIVFEPVIYESEGFWDEFRKYFFDLYKQLNNELESLKKEKNILTHNDLLHYAAQLVQNKDIAEQITEEIKYLFVDECQDINKDQMKIFETLMDYLSLVIVGDEKQSIYAFRGSDREAFKQLIAKMQEKNADKTIVDINFRSNKELIKIFNKIFSSKFKFKKEKLNFENILLKDNGRKCLENKGVFEVLYNQQIADVVKYHTQKAKYQQKHIMTN